MKVEVDMLDQYRQVVGNDKIEQLQQVAQPLQNLRIVHVNSTRIGGGVAEILEKMVPLTNSLGVETLWEVIQGDTEFYQCTKSFHNALQGNQVVIPQHLLNKYEAMNVVNAEKLRPILEEADIVFIHDPQPLPLITHFPKRKGKWIWRCHIDASRPNSVVWRYLKKFIVQYDATIFSLPDFAHHLPIPTYIIPPSIDPLSDKNRELDQSEIDKVYGLFNIDPQRPMILQVSRYDIFKDPVGVIQAYRLAKKMRPDLQLVLAGGGATDDPEGEAVLKEVTTAALGDSDIHILLLPPDAHVTINALQRASNIVLQKSIKEGFGLTVTEAMWKSKPVIGGNVGGIRLQVYNWDNGFLVNTPEGAAHRIRYLLQNPHKAHEMGIKGRDFTRERFLNTRHLLNYLTLILTLHHPHKNRIELNLD